FAPQSRFVAEFVGAANVVEATAVDGWLMLPGGRLRVPAGAAGPLTVMVRPEAIGIIAAEGAELTGRIETVSFVGDRQRLTVSGAADRPLAIDAANSLALEVGERVGLAIAPDAVRLLPGDRR